MKKRLDQLLVEKGHFISRTKAQAAILVGVVYVNNQKACKAGEMINPESSIEIKGAPHPYVSRGGVKLEQALKDFKIKVEGKTVMDVGASTGGFTDCLLKQGAEKVYAVDVGYGQLDWKLRQDPRVRVIERKNIRYLTLEDLDLNDSDIELCTIDVSFISLAKVLPAVHALIKNRAEVIALIKPQFEARREQVGKGGIVRDDKIHQEVIEKVKTTAEKTGFQAKAIIKSPITGTDGNVEFFIHLLKS